jgi:hypothetical protein
MSLQRKSKWMQPKKSIIHKFEDQAEAMREQNKAYWNELALPKHKPTNRKPKPHKGSHNTIKIRLKYKAYKEAEERDEGYCIVCGGEAQQHHHIIKQGTRYGPEYIQQMSNIVMVCMLCHAEIHNPSKGKSDKQIYLEQWQQRYYPEYSAMMKELAKVTGCRDQWLIDRWNEQQYNNNAIGG